MASWHVPSPIDFGGLIAETVDDHDWRQALVQLIEQEIPWQPAPDALIPDRSQQLGGGDEVTVFQVERQSATAVKSAWNGKMQEHSVDYTLSHNLTSIGDIYSVATSIDSFIHNLIAPILVNAEDNDYVSLQIFHDELATLIFVSYTRKQHFSPQSFLNKIFKFVQSGVSRFLLNGVLTLRVSIFKVYSGTGHNPRVSVEADTYFGRKNDVVRIVNNGSFCGYLAITLGFIYALSRKENKPVKNWRRLVAPRSTHLLDEMIRFCLERGIDASIPFDLTIADAIQSTILTHQLIVIKRPTAASTFDRSDMPLYMGADREMRIILEYVEGPTPHYNLVKKMTGYHNVDSWCYRCWRATSPNHLCLDACHDCRQPSKCIAALVTSCNECNIDFVSADCYAKHLESGICKRRVKCPECDVIHLKTRDVHVCDESVCSACGEKYSLPPHYCYIKPKDVSAMQKEDDLLKVIIAFDIECRLVDVGNNTQEHFANLLISHTVCDYCSACPGLCAVCGPLEHVYFGDDCVKQFISHVMDNLQVEMAKKKVNRILVVSHNFCGYDGRFVLEELLSRKFIGVDSVFNGTKILKLDVGLVRFLDSLSFLPLKLADLPKSFPHPSIKLRKGTFPHLFNRKENYYYNRSPYPDLHYYSPWGMKPKAKDELIEWYETKKNDCFNFKEQLISYCRMDVQILLNAVLQFRLLFKQASGIDPLTRCFTLASAAMETFRGLFLREKSIGICPLTGYFSKRKGSVIADAWIDWKEKQSGSKIYREKRIGNYYADGYEPITNTVYEFFGCTFHGCPTCYPNREDRNKVSEKTYFQLHKETIDRLTYYERRGFTVDFIWEHEMKIRNPYIKKRMKQLSVVREKAIHSIRDSLCGGRNENFKLIYSCEENEQLRYLDFTSLYPFVLKRRKFPLGHPIVITEGLDVEWTGQYFGFVYCRILPPTNLDPPVLPYKCGNKLMFGLCRTCMEEREALCTHDTDERALEYVFCTPEIDKAIEVGYRLLDVYAVLHYPEQEGDLFRPYVDMFLKIKQEKSGAPPGVETEQQLADYIRDYATNEGISLDPAAIDKNNGLRLISKLMLNSLWGKLVQRPNQPKTSIISDYQSLSNLLSNEDFEVMGSSILKNDNVIVTYKHVSDIIAGPGNTSPAIGCFVTCWARLELYNLIERIETVRPGRIAYADTDSILFIERDGDPQIELGNYLGQLTDEIPDGFRCVKAILAGCKSYGLELRSVLGNIITYIIKVKGLSLTSEAMTQLNFETIENMIYAFASDQKIQLPVAQTVFRPVSKYDQRMTTRKYDKLFRVTSEKRFLLGFDTRPYGYKSSSE